MEKKIYCLKDNKAGFLNPVTADNEGIAVRQFSLMVNDERGTLVSACPQDFELFELASFDTVSGKLVVLDSPRFVVGGSSLIHKEDTESGR